MPDDALTRERVREALENAADYCGEVAHANEYWRGRRDDRIEEPKRMAEIVRALTAALDDPARWCGVVGDVTPEMRLTFAPFEGCGSIITGSVHTGRLIVTPHQEGA